MRLYEETIAARRELLGAEHVETIISSQNLAKLYERLGQRDRAIALYEESVAALARAKNPTKWIQEPEMLAALSNAYLEAGRTREAVETLEKAGRSAVRASPQGVNRIARMFASSATPGLRNPALAVEFASKAVELMPREAAAWNTLGVAQYRAADHRAAVETLTKSMELRGGGGSAADWFFLAMSHRQLGDKAEARRWYDRAAGWMDTNHSTDEELIRFRREAAEVVGVTETKHPVPSTAPATTQSQSPKK